MVDAKTKSPVLSIAESLKHEDSAIATTQDQRKNEQANADPLGPPPRPPAAVPNTPDYFSVNHSHIATETNPFEVSFLGASTGGVQTPGGTKLPSVASLTSPAGILGGTPFPWGGLRSGPLSPAMLSGPQKDNDYFSDGHHLRGGFPTPNESGLRSGLTPGGGGSMFPDPTPTALFGQLASGGATPNTLDFHRTAMNAAQAQKRDAAQAEQNITSQPQEIPNGMDVKPAIGGQFDQHDANDAANGLFLLAQARSGPQNTNHYTIAPPIMPVHAHPQPSMQMGIQSQETSPQMANRNNGSISTASGRGASEMSATFSDENEQQSRPNTRNKGKKAIAQNAHTNGRRKAEDTPAKGPANKKSKANNGHAMQSEPPSEDEGPDLSKDEYNANGKKMTDEEKRKNFLERNRVAALKCRQRKKQWLANLQQKVEIFSNENDQLSAQISQLRDEIVNLKTILQAHKDCPVSQQQGLGGNGMHDFINGYAGQMNPYNLAVAMQGQQPMATGQPIPDRRFS